jgi:poly(3-hydroxybutyrate) depolymerase
MQENQLSRHTLIGKALAILFSFVFVSMFSAGRLLADNGGQSQITIGSGSFQFADAKGSIANPIRVWFFRPEALRNDSPIVFVMHGVHRDAQRYCNDWSPYAQKYNFLLVCPEFDAAHFSTKAYQCGNILDQSNNLNAESKWTFTTIENLFDYVKTSAGNTSKSYYIFGHSAGGQFVHRFALFMPNARYARAIAANPGWYTMPNYSGHKFPYGLRDSNLQESSVKASFGRDFILMLGQDDTDANDPDLRQTASAEEQGATRLDRGQNYFRAAQAEASRLGTALKWRLQTVPGAHHSDAQMAAAAAADFFTK